MSTFFAASSCTALRPSAAVVIQYGAVGAAGSGMVMPRPAVKKRAAPGIVSPRILNGRSPVSCPRLIAALDAVVGAPLQVLRQRLARLAEMRVRVDDRRHHGLAGQVHALRPAGTLTSAALPTCVMRAPLTRKRGVLDRRASVADDEPRTFESRDSSRLCVTGGRPDRNSDESDEQAFHRRGLYDPGGTADVWYTGSAFGRTGRAG